MADLICVSGGFDPLHSGHLEMFQHAATYGDLMVILNSDEWLIRKKGFIFLPWGERAEIIRELRSVKSVVLAKDDDGTVCDSLRQLQPRFFCNGGDRKEGNTPEVQLCLASGVECLWNIGGTDKRNSSSTIAKRAMVERTWGRYITLDEGTGYKVKKLIVDPGKSLSKQYHLHREEYWQVVEGIATVLWGKRLDRYDHPVSFQEYIPKEIVHQLRNEENVPLVVIETQFGDYLGEDDIIRL